MHSRNYKLINIIDCNLNIQYFILFLSIIHFILKYFNDTYISLERASKSKSKSNKKEILQILTYKN